VPSWHERHLPSPYALALRQYLPVHSNFLTPALHAGRRRCFRRYLQLAVLAQCWASYQPKAENTEARKQSRTLRGIHNHRIFTADCRRSCPFPRGPHGATGWTMHATPSPGSSSAITWVAGCACAYLDTAVRMPG